MILALPVAFALVQHCAPGIAPVAILSIASVESRLDPLAINVNHVGRLHAHTPDEAARLAARWIAAGYSVDLGIAQINSANLARTGLSIPQAFNACANLRAAQTMFELNYARALEHTSGLDAISRAFSLYNSGSITTGFSNNYVARVWRAAADVLPRIEALGSGSGVAARIARNAAPGRARALPVPSFVVGPADRTVLVFR